MDFQKEKEAYLGELLERDVITQDEFRDLVFKPEINAFDSNYLSSRFIDKINFGWSAWQAKAQAVPEGFVLISAEQLSQWGHMANYAEQYGCPECFEARGYAHSLACEINEFFAIEAQEPAND